MTKKEFLDILIKGEIEEFYYISGFRICDIPFEKIDRLQIKMRFKKNDYEFYYTNCGESIDPEGVFLNFDDLKKNVKKIKKMLIDDYINSLDEAIKERLEEFNDNTGKN